jgi:hypothetical protein
VAIDDIGEIFPQVSPHAYDLASYVDSYERLPEQAA